MTFTMVGHLSECILLAYRTPAESVRQLVPRGLNLVTRDGWAFWNVVACRIERMRPEGLPGWCGVSYCHVAYRLYVKARTADQATVEGLYFVRSDANHRLLTKFGNVLTAFRFHQADITLDTNSSTLAFRVQNSDDGHGDAELLVGEGGGHVVNSESCFSSFDEALKFLHYPPLGLSVDVEGKHLRLAEVLRDEDAWRETPISIANARWAFLDHVNQRNIHLELATEVAPISYRWRLGKRAKLII